MPPRPICRPWRQRRQRVEKVLSLGVSIVWQLDVKICFGRNVFPVICNCPECVLVSVCVGVVCVHARTLAHMPIGKLVIHVDGQHNRIRLITVSFYFLSLFMAACEIVCISENCISVPVCARARACLCVCACVQHNINADK